MAYAFGMRASATAAVLYCVAVGVEKRSIGWCSSGAKLCACCNRVRGSVTAFRFLCGPGCWLVHLFLLLLYFVGGGGTPFFPVLEPAKCLIPVSFPFDSLSVFRVVYVDECWLSVWCALAVSLECVVT